MKAKLLFAMVLVGLLITLPGCATMFTEKTQDVSFKTKPAGAEVAVGTKTCITPCTLTIDKGNWNVQAIITKDGYGAQNLIMMPKIEPWTLANFANMGVGFFVDMVTGTYIKYDKEFYSPLAKLK